MDAPLTPTWARCLAVWLCVTAAGLAVASLVASDLVPDAADFETWIVAAAAWALCLASAWASTVTGLVAVQVARSAVVPHAGIPAPVRLLLLRACGAALAGGLAAGLAAGPALATPGVLERDRPAPPSGPVSAVPVEVSTATQAPARGTVVVRAGGSLWQVTDDLLTERTGQEPSVAEIAAAWPGLYAANRTLVGPDPDLVRPGVPLSVPSHLRPSHAGQPGQPSQKES